MSIHQNCLNKNERLTGKIIIDKLYTTGDSVAVFPLRAVFIPIDKPNSPAASILLSVSKKRFRHAVDRNRVKRQLREAYRLGKHRFIEELLLHNKKMAIAILYLDRKHYPTPLIKERLDKLLRLILENESHKTNID